MFRLMAFILLLLMATGCGGGLDTASVSGVVTLDQKPLPNASVTFTPNTTEGIAPASNGMTDANGRYTLTVTASGEEGAIIGNHIVTIALVGEEKTGEDADVIDPAEDDGLPDHNLSFDVKPGQNEANFDL